MSDQAPDFFEHRPTPPKGERLCDFCGSLDPQWAYPCRDFVQYENVDLLMEKIDTGALRNQRLNIEARSDGAWAACSTCHALIERGDRVRLARRSAKRLLKKLDPEMARAWPLGNAIQHVRSIHDGFWKNREGKPERINQ